MQKKRVFRVFVSSTFADMREERNALQRFAFPRLRELCERHGCRFQAIDLRWGIREQATLDQKTMRICLTEIERCQNVTPRPNFIVLLGDRYGWCPLPHEVPQEEFDAIFKHTTEDDQRKMLSFWYRRDENAIPPVYCLRPRTGQFVTPTVWNDVERRLRGILANAAEELFEEECRLKYVSSATHQEVVSGALNVAQAQRHVFGFFRQIQNLEELADDLPSSTSAQALVDLDERGCLDDTALDRQRTLKKTLRAVCSGRVFEYPARWLGDNVSTSHLETLCEDVVLNLSQTILEQISLIDEATPLEQEIGYHLSFGEDRAACFVGRETTLRHVADYIRGSHTSPLVVFGTAGCGKSALLARAAEQARKAWPQAQLVSRYIGATPTSSNLRALLDSLSGEIDHLYAAEDEHDVAQAIKDAMDSISSHSPPTENVSTLESDAIQGFVRRMALARADMPLIVLLDGIDQLSSTALADDSPWLPVRLPEHVRLVVSLQPGPNLDAMMNRLPPSSFCALDILDPEESERLLATWLREAKRTLQGAQYDLVRVVFRDSGLPLHLRLVFEEVRRWNSWSDPAQLPLDTCQVIQTLFARLCAQHGRLFFSRSMGYLTAAKEGLTEEELLDLLSRDEKFFSDFLAQAHHDLPDMDHTQRRLPVVIWSRLFFDLEPYLMERDGDGTHLLTFYHRELGMVAAQEFLAGDDKEQFHQSMATYFKEQQLWTVERRLPNSRKLSELAFHQIHGALFSELEATICDLPFLEAKCAAGMTYGLLDDYADALNAQGLPKALAARLERYRQFIGKECHLLVNNPGSLYQQALNQPDDHPVSQEAEKLLQSCPPSRPFFRWLNKAQTESAKGGNRTLSGHANEVDSVAMTPDGQRIVSAGADGTLRVWQLPAGRCETVLKGHENKVRVVAVTPDGSRAVSGSWDETVRIWQLPYGPCMMKFTEGVADVAALVITPDGRQVISGDGEGVMRFWDLATGQCVQMLTSDSPGIISMCVTPDGQYLVIGSLLGTMEVWELRTGQCANRWETSLNPVTSLYPGPAQHQMVSGHMDGRIRVWELPVGRCITEWRAYEGSGVTAVAVTPDRRYVISGTADGTVRAWDSVAKRALIVWEGHSGAIHTVAVTPDGRQVVSGGMDRTLKIWDFSNRTPAASNAHHSDWVRSIVFSGDGQYVASGGRDGQVRIWEAATGSCLATLGHAGQEVRAVALFPDGRRVLSGMSKGTVRLWDWHEGECIAEFQAHADAVCAMALLGDSLSVVSGGRNGTVKLWDLRTGRCLAAWKGHRGPVNAIAPVRDGQHMVTGSEDGTLKLWQFSDGRCLCTFEGHRIEKNTLSVTHDGRFLISGGPDQMLKLWELASGRCVAERRSHGWHVTAVAVTSDGGHVLSASGDNFFDDKLTVWRLPELEPVAAFHGIGAVQSCAAGPGGLIATGNEQGRIHFFRLEGLSATPAASETRPEVSTSLDSGQVQPHVPEVSVPKQVECPSGDQKNALPSEPSDQFVSNSAPLPATGPPAQSVPHSETEPYGELEQQDAERVDEALRAIRRRDIPTARRLLHDVVARAPVNYLYKFRRGKDIYVKFWDREEFLAYIEAAKLGLTAAGDKVVWLKSAYPRAFYYLAFLDVEAQAYDRARAHLEAALKLEPDQPNCIGEMAMVQSGLGRKEEAIRMYDRAISVRPYLPTSLHAKFLRGRGVALIDLQMLDQAEASLIESLQYDPNSSVAYKELAYIRNLRSGGRQAQVIVGPSSDVKQAIPAQNSSTRKQQEETDMSRELFTKEFLSNLPESPLVAAQAICKRFFENCPTIEQFQLVAYEEVVEASSLLLTFVEEIYPESIPVDYLSFVDSPGVRLKVYNAFQWLKEDSIKRLQKDSR